MALSFALPPDISPQYQNLFIARPQLPSALQFEGKTEIPDKFFVTIRSTSIPGVTHERIADNFLTLQYYFRDNKIAFNTIQFTFMLTMEEKNLHKLFQLWHNAIMGHYGNTPNFAMGTYPNEYKGAITLYLLDAKTEPLYIITLANAFPTALSDLTVAYTGGRELMEFNITVSFDYPILVL